MKIYSTFNLYCVCVLVCVPEMLLLNPALLFYSFVLLFSLCDLLWDCRQAIDHQSLSKFSTTSPQLLDTSPQLLPPPPDCQLRTQVFPWQTDSQFTQCCSVCLCDLYLVLYLYLIKSFCNACQVYLCFG